MSSHGLNFKRKGEEVICSELSSYCHNCISFTSFIVIVKIKCITQLLNLVQHPNIDQVYKTLVLKWRAADGTGYPYPALSNRKGVWRGAPVQHSHSNSFHGF